MFCADVLTAANLECIYPCKLVEIAILYICTQMYTCNLSSNTELLWAVHCNYDMGRWKHVSGYPGDNLVSRLWLPGYHV